MDKYLKWLKDYFGYYIMLRRLVNNKIVKRLELED